MMMAPSLAHVGQGRCAQHRHEGTGHGVGPRARGARARARVRAAPSRPRSCAEDYDFRWETATGARSQKFLTYHKFETPSGRLVQAPRGAELDTLAIVLADRSCKAGVPWHPHERAPRVAAGSDTPPPPTTPPPPSLVPCALRQPPPPPPLRASGYHNPVGAWHSNRRCPTANRQPSPTANRQPPPTANRSPPTATNRQPLFHCFCGFVPCPWCALCGPDEGGVAPLTSPPPFALWRPGDARMGPSVWSVGRSGARKRARAAHQRGTRPLRWGRPVRSCPSSWRWPSVRAASPGGFCRGADVRVVWGQRQRHLPGLPRLRAAVEPLRVLPRPPPALRHRPGLERRPRGRGPPRAPPQVCPPAPAQAWGQPVPLGTAPKGRGGGGGGVDSKTSQTTPATTSTTPNTPTIGRR